MNDEIQYTDSVELDYTEPTTTAPATGSPFVIYYSRLLHESLCVSRIQFYCLTCRTEIKKDFLRVSDNLFKTRYNFCCEDCFSKMDIEAAVNDSRIVRIKCIMGNSEKFKVRVVNSYELPQDAKPLIERNFIDTKLSELNNFDSADLEIGKIFDNETPTQ